MILVDKAWLNHAKSNFEIASRDPMPRFNPENYCFVQENLI